MSRKTHNNHSLKLATLYRLAQRLEADRDLPLADLRRRDHDIGRQCQATDDSARLQYWLQQVDGAGQERQPCSEDAAAMLVRVFSLVFGFLGMAGFLLASGKGLVNALVFLLLFVLVQIPLCAAAAVVMLRSLRGDPPAVMPISPTRLLLRRMVPDRRYLRESQGVLRLLLLRYGQEMGAVFTLGAIAAFFLVLAFSDFTFVWGSTFNISDDFVLGFSRMLAAPWSGWLPGAVVSPELVAQSRYHPALSDLAQADLVLLRGWWPFLILSMLCYALLPRLVLWLLSRFFYRRQLRQAITAYPGVDLVLARMKTPVVQTQATQAEQSHDPEPTRVALDESLVLLVWAAALEQADHARFTTLQAVPRDNVVSAGLGAPEDDNRSREQIEGYRPERLLVAVKSWEPPMADLADFLRDLKSIRRCTLCLVPLPEREVSEHNQQEWRDFARELPVELVDVLPLGAVSS